MHNLDQFFSQIYRYWEEKGFFVILVARILNLAALAFTIFASGVLLLGIDYSALQNECLKKETCNLWDVAVIKHPLAGPYSLWKTVFIAYVAIFTGYLLFATAHLIQEVWGIIEVKHFFATHVGISERALRAATWPEVAARLVTAQHTVRLCISRDLTEHNIVSRIMRRENYLIGMLNQGVLALNVPLPGLRHHVLLTKTVEWNLRWCLLDPMFDDATFKLRHAFLNDPQGLQRRFRVMAVMNAFFSPFLLIFLVIYFFMKNAEAFYHHPSSIGARRWSPAARWSLREFNELPHFVAHRLNAGHSAAELYIAQFPNYAVSHLARFVAFLAGSFAAVLIALTLVDERVLERDFAGGRQTVWWLALLGVLLAISRSLIVEPSTASFDPGLALFEVAAHTHYMPRHWRGRAHSLEVQDEFQSLFRYRAALFLEELSSVVLTPVLLWFSLPRCAEAILAYVAGNTVNVEGVGDVCSQAAFRGQEGHRCFNSNGNGNGNQEEYGCDGAFGAAGAEIQEDKLEKSLVSFAAAYPTWEPPLDARNFLSKVVEEGGIDDVIENENEEDSFLGFLNNVEANNNKHQNYFPPSSSLNNDGKVDSQYYYRDHNDGEAHGSESSSRDSLQSLLNSRCPQFARIYQHTTTMNGNRRHHHHGGSSNGGGGGGGGLFASAITLDSRRHHHNHHGSSNNGGGGGGGLGNLFLSTSNSMMAMMAPEEERVVVGQALLQRYHDRHQKASRSSSATSAGAGAGAGLSVRTAAGAAVAAPSPRRGDSNLNTAANGNKSNTTTATTTTTTTTAIGRGWARSRGGTPRSQPQQQQQQHPMMATSPVAAGRSVRELSSELSVMSREPSEVREIHQQQQQRVVNDTPPGSPFTS